MRRVLVSLALLILVSTVSLAAESMRVGIVVFDGFLTSEVTAPIEVFAKASTKGDTRFDVITLGVTKDVVVSEEGLRLVPDATLKTAPKLDILVVPSALDVEGLVANEPVVAFIKERGSRARWLASHCAGAFLLGQAGLLKGRKVTTYVGGWADLRKRFPEAKVLEEHVVVDGNLVSSIGGTTSYDGALTLLGEITGDWALTDTVADALYYFSWLHRDASKASQ